MVSYTFQNFAASCSGVDNPPLARCWPRSAHTANISCFKGNVDAKMNGTSVHEDAAPGAGDDSGPRQDRVAPESVDGVYESTSPTAVDVAVTERPESDAKDSSQQPDGADSMAQDTSAVSPAAVSSDSFDPASISLQSLGATTAPPVPISVSVSDAISFSNDIPHLFSNSDKRSANHIGSSDTQVIQTGSGATKSLRTVSLEPTLLNIEELQDTQEASQVDFDITDAAAQHTEDENMGSDVPIDDSAQPEPPASPTSNTLPSNSSTSTHDNSPTVPPKSDISGGRTPSANRLSISYAGGNRRLVIDAEVVQSFKLFRQDGRIEVVMNIDKEPEDGLKGILVGSFPLSFLTCFSPRVAGRSF